MRCWSRREDHAVFDEAFRLFWKSRELIEKMIAMFSPVAPDKREKQKPRAAENRVSQAMFEGHQKQQKPKKETPEIEIDARLHRVRQRGAAAKDFAQMTAAELASAQGHRELRLPLRLWKDAALQAGPARPPDRSARHDALGARTGGELILPKFRSPREMHPPLVVLADISGSMSQYSRIFLHFLHALAEKRRRVHTFVFGTRLTNLTRQMRHRDPDQALADCSRGGEGLVGRHAHRRHAARVQPAVVAARAGAGRGRAADHRRAGARRRRGPVGGDGAAAQICRRLIWLNPLLRFDGFEARARGVAPCCRMSMSSAPVHNLNALSDLSPRWTKATGRKPIRADGIGLARSAPHDHICRKRLRRRCLRHGTDAPLRCCIDRSARSAAIAEGWMNEGREVAVATVVETWGSAPRPVGSHLVIDADGNFQGSVSGGCVEGAVVSEAST
jgi:uncharacterized protein with von Willebrand factor type A (vWA) domain